MTMFGGESLSSSRNIIVLVFLGLLFACTTPKVIESFPPQGTTYTEPHIAFLMFELSKVDSGFIVSLKDQIVSEGQLKLAHLDHRELENSGWEAAVLNKDEMVVAFHRLGNPFVYEAEIADENGRLQRKSIEIENTELNFRLPLDAASRYIALRSMVNGEVLTHKLIQL